MWRLITQNVGPQMRSKLFDIQIIYVTSSGKTWLMEGQKEQAVLLVMFWFIFMVTHIHLRWLTTTCLTWFRQNQAGAHCAYLWMHALNQSCHGSMWANDYIFSHMLTELQIRCVKLTSINSSCFISSPNQWDDSNKWSNIGFGEEIGILEMKIRTLSGALMLS